MSISLFDLDTPETVLCWCVTWCQVNKKYIAPAEARDAVSDPCPPSPYVTSPPDEYSPGWGAQSAGQVPASVSRQPGVSSQGLSPDVLTFPRAWRRRRSSLTVLISWPARYKSPGARLLRLACGSAPVSWAAPQKHLPPPSALSAVPCPVTLSYVWIFAVLILLAAGCIKLKLDMFSIKVLENSENYIYLIFCEILKIDGLLRNIPTSFIFSQKKDNTAAI